MGDYFLYFFLEKEMSKKDTIFVQIASYRDPQLIPTLIDLITNAKKPENLQIGICWQHGDDETIELFLENEFDIITFDHTEGSLHGTIQLKYGDTSLELIDVPYFESKGACWARHSIQQLYNDEKYTLQLDSHHRFVEDWDTICIEMLEGLRVDGSSKPLITGYIPDFDPENDPKGRKMEAWGMNFDQFIPEGAVFFKPAIIENWKNLTKPIPARFYSAHFCFVDGNFCEEVQHDPDYFFHGEEISIAVRAFTHGYDLFHSHKLVAWHEYTRKNRTKIWDDHTHVTKKAGLINIDWHERNLACHNRNRILFGMDGEDPTQVDFGKYGFGSKRTLRQYEEYAGISFKLRGVQQATLDFELPPNKAEYKSEKEWIDSFQVSNDIRIYVSKEDLGGEIEDDYEFFYIGAHNKHGVEIIRRDLSAKEVYNYFKNGNIDYQFKFITAEIPATYTIWPVSKSKGWLDKIVKPVDYYVESK